jgi:hypothetical protein
MTKQIKLSYLEPFIDQTQVGEVQTIVSISKGEIPESYLLSVHAKDADKVNKALRSAGLKVKSFHITQRGLSDKPEFPKSTKHSVTGE